jgi:predicted nucleotidyltransferase component of viral defense system
VSNLTHFQNEIVRLFFSLPASHGFLLAGGGALLASNLTSRPTQDLDFFGVPDVVDIGAARDQLVESLTSKSIKCEHVHESDRFVRLRLSTGVEELVVDLAIESPPGRPPAMTIVGPTFDPEELAGRKLAALFSRAEARDFTDVFELARRFDRHLVLLRATEVDLGIEPRMLATMMRTISRFTDDELPIEVSEVMAVRAFFGSWADELDTSE